MQLPDVLLQVEVAAEAFATSGAGEGLLVVVCVHVEGQIVDLVEGLIADGALVLFLPAVRQLVVLVVSCEIRVYELKHNVILSQSFCLHNSSEKEFKKKIQRGKGVTLEFLPPS